MGKAGDRCEWRERRQRGRRHRWGIAGASWASAALSGCSWAVQQTVLEAWEPLERQQRLPGDPPLCTASPKPLEQRSPALDDGTHRHHLRQREAETAGESWGAGNRKSFTRETAEGCWTRSAECVWDEQGSRGTPALAASCGRPTLPARSAWQLAASSAHSGAMRRGKGLWSMCAAGVA